MRFFHGKEMHIDILLIVSNMPPLVVYIYTTIGELSSKFEECLAVQSQFDSDHDQIWQACADRSGNRSYLNKLAP